MTRQIFVDVYKRQASHPADRDRMLYNTALSGIPDFCETVRESGFIRNSACEIIRRDFLTVDILDLTMKDMGFPHFMNYDIIKNNRYRYGQADSETVCWGWKGIIRNR